MGNVFECKVRIVTPGGQTHIKVLMGGWRLRLNILTTVTVKCHSHDCVCVLSWNLFQHLF